MPILKWLTRDEDVRAYERVPYRLIEEVTELSMGERDSGNMLIQGDNLDALKALLPYFAGQVKCIFIDPPYNTKSAFAHYDDNLEHSKWLAMMWPRLQLLRELLSEEGTIWVTIDSSEGHYLKVIMDEIFGRQNFIDTVTWVKTSSVHNNADFFSSSTDMMHVFGKSIIHTKFGRVPRSARNSSDYSNPDDDPRGSWTSSPLHVSLTSGQRGAQYAKTGKSSGLYPIISPLGEEVYPPKGRCWGYSADTIKELERENRIWWGKTGKNQPRMKRFLSEQKDGVVPTTLWSYEDVGHNQEAKKEASSFPENGAVLFSTPKPERLLQRILQISTNPGDLVLDSFVGSGTTSAVAHKMGRRHIGIEMGEHAVTHCVPRLNKVIEGEQGGISKSVDWKGGGGCRFYKLGPPIFDHDGQIHSGIRFPVLAAHIWFAETGQPWHQPEKLEPYLGEFDGRGYALLYNGILGDKSISGGNVLTRKTLSMIRAAQGSFQGPVVVYGERTALSETTLKAEKIEFKQTPYDVKARK